VVNKHPRNRIIDVMVASFLIVGETCNRVGFKAKPSIIFCSSQVDPGNRKIQIRS